MPTSRVKAEQLVNSVKEHLTKERNRLNIDLDDVKMNLTVDITDRVRFNTVEPDDLD
jgi:hypothetical protein